MKKKKTKKQKNEQLKELEVLNLSCMPDVTDW